MEAGAHEFSGFGKGCIIYIHVLSESNRDELSLRMVRAFPKASRMEFDCNTCCSMETSWLLLLLLLLLLRLLLLFSAAMITTTTTTTCICSCSCSSIYCTTTCTFLGQHGKVIQTNLGSSDRLSYRHRIDSPETRMD